MPLSELQAALARILTDEPVRQSFLNAGIDGALPAELSAYGLSAPEWRQLRTISSERLNLYAHLLRDKRIAKVPDVLPWTWFLLGESLKWVVPMYCREHLPSTIRKFNEAQTFCRFLLENASLISPPYVPDVARYEITMAAFGQRRFDPANTAPALLELLDGNDWRTLPALSCAQTKNMELLEFDHDLEPILAFAQKSEHPPEWFAGRTSILFRVSPEGELPRIYKIKAAASALLRMCDGHRPIRDIVDRSVASQDMPSDARERLEKACIAVLKRFLEDDIIELCSTTTE